MSDRKVKNLLETEDSLRAGTSRRGSLGRSLIEAYIVVGGAGGSGSTMRWLS
jgi:hypothetical protein